MDLRDAFHDDNGDVCSAFFGVSHDGDVAGVARVWSDMRRLADGRCVSDTDFWTVVAHHERLAVALSTCVTTALHHTRNGSDSVVSTSDEAAVAAVLVRLATTTEVCMQRNVDVASLATRLEQLLPSRLLPPMAVVLLRHCASCSRQHNKDNDDKDKTTTAAAAAAVDTRAAAATVTSLLLLCPPLLCRLRQHMAGWCDDVDKLAVRCVVEARRGRYQRSAGDVLALLSLTHRTPQPLWAALQCAPLLADYVPLQRTLRALRVLVDVAMPLVQHMVLVCDALTPRRAALTRLCAATVNAAVHAAMLLLLYRTYSVRSHHDRGSNAIATAAAAAATTRTQPQYVWSMPALVQTTYAALHAYVRTHVGGYPRVLLDSWCNNSSSNNNNVHTLMHHLVPPLLDDTTTADVHLGHVLLTLTAPLRDSSDVAVALRHARVQFAEAVLRALVQQGMRLHTLVRDRLVTHDEAQQLGGTPDDCNATKQQQEQEQQQQPQQHDDADDAGSSSSDDDDDKADAATRAAVAMVRGVFAHFTRRGVRAALAYYGNDTEQLVLDASADNLPPHLLPLLHKQPQPSSSSRPRQQSGDVAQQGIPVDEAMPPQQQQPQSDEDALDVRALCRRILRECDDDDDGAVSQPQHGDVNDEDDGAAVLSLGNDDVLYDTLLSQPGNDKDSTRDATAAVTSSSPWLYTTRVDGAAATHGDAVGMSAAFRVDDATREKIRVLSALMYDDELDDHALDETHVDDDVDHNVTDDDDDDKLNNNNSAALHAPPPPPDVHAGGGDDEARRVRDTYHDKQWHAQRARERATRAAAAATTSSRPQPAYANKRKTTTTRRDGKGDVQRALRKGRVDVF